MKINLRFCDDGIRASCGNRFRSYKPAGQWWANWIAWCYRYPLFRWLCSIIDTRKLDTSDDDGHERMKVTQIVKKVSGLWTERNHDFPAAHHITSRWWRRCNFHCWGGLPSCQQRRFILIWYKTFQKAYVLRKDYYIRRRHPASKRKSSSGWTMSFKR